MRGIGFKGVRLGGRTSNGGNSPTPSTGFYVPLNFTGTQVSQYSFRYTNASASTYNIISRTGAGGDNYNMGIFSNQTINSDDNFVIGGDEITDGFESFFVGFGLQSETGINYVDIDFCFFVEIIDKAIFYF